MIHFTYSQRTESIGMNGSLVDKDVVGTIVWDDETKAFLGVEPFHCTGTDCIRKAPNLVT